MEKQNNNTSENGKEAPVSGQENITAKGEARFEKISESISKAKEKVSGMFKSGFSKFGKFFKASAVGVLSTPEATVEGVKYVKDKTVEGANLAYEKAGDAAEFAWDKMNQAETWTSQKATEAYDFTAEKAQQAKQFVENKSTQVKEFAQDKILVAEAVVSLAKDKTVENLNIAKEAVVDRFDKTVEYGKNAIDSAKHRAQEVKKSFLDKKANFFKKILERKFEIQTQKLEKTKRKLAQYQQVEDLGEKLAA